MTVLYLHTLWAYSLATISATLSVYTFGYRGNSVQFGTIYIAAFIRDVIYEAKYVLLEAMVMQFCVIVDGTWGRVTTHCNSQWDRRIYYVIQSCPRPL